MRRTSLIVVLAAVWMWTTMLPADVWLGHRHLRGYYDGYGCGVLYDLSSAWNASRYIAQSERLMGQQIAAQQAAARQSDIRNEMSVDAWRRSEQIFAQQQSDRDWWFQVQQQQVAASRQAAQFAAMTSAFEPAPRAATDVIKWPRLLQGPQFADQRTQIEAPYRRNSKASSVPTAKDLQGMIEATQQMKLILKGMTANISAQDYLDTQAFLDKLAAEARTRIEKTSPKK